MQIPLGEPVIGLIQVEGEQPVVYNDWRDGKPILSFHPMPVPASEVMDVPVFATQ